MLIGKVFVSAWLLGVIRKQSCLWLGLIKVNSKGLIKTSQSFILRLYNVKPVNPALSLINVCQSEADNPPSNSLTNSCDLSFLNICESVFIPLKNLLVLAQAMWDQNKVCDTYGTDKFWRHLLSLTPQGSSAELWQCLGLEFFKENPASKVFLQKIVAQVIMSPF